MSLKQVSFAPFIRTKEFRFSPERCWAPSQPPYWMHWPRLPSPTHSLCCWNNAGSERKAIRNRWLKARTGKQTAEKELWCQLQTYGRQRSTNIQQLSSRKKVRSYRMQCSKVEDTVWQVKKCEQPEKRLRMCLLKSAHKRPLAQCIWAAMNPLQRICR